MHMIIEPPWTVVGLRRCQYTWYTKYPYIIMFVSMLFVFSMLFDDMGEM